MAESTLSLNVAISEDVTTRGGNMSRISPSKTEHVLGLENIQIHLPLENVEITGNSDQGNAKEKEQHSSRPVDNVPNTEEEKRVEMRRRIGVVEANDTAQAERRKARVLSKKFGEGILHERSSIFNKKL